MKKRISVLFIVLFAVTVLFQPVNNPFVNALAKQSRMSYYKQAIPRKKSNKTKTIKKNVKKLIKYIKKNGEK